MTTTVPLGGTVVVCASDGRDNQRRVLRLPSDQWLHVAFNGTPYGGRLSSYGNHGEVVIGRSN